MNSSLWRKELRALAPFIGLAGFFAVIDWSYILLTGFPDQFPLSELINAETETEGLITSLIMALAVSAGLLTREQDDGTLSFLDGLPVSRTRIFLVKFGVAFAILLLLPLSRGVATVVFRLLSQTSLEPVFHWDLILTSMGMGAAMSLVYLCLGLAFSFLRRFSLLVLGLLFWAYQVLRELEVPGTAKLNLFAVTEAAFDGQRWLFPGELLMVQLGLAGVCAAVAWGAFQMTGDRSARWVESLKRNRGVSWIGVISIAAAACVWIALGVFFAVKEGFADEEAEVVYESWNTSRAATRHYQILFPEAQAADVEALVDRADKIFDMVTELVKARDVGKITVDLTGSIPRHAGQAYWKRIRMNLEPGADADELAAILGHETMHVLIDLASDSRLTEKFNSTRLFHEGLATYAEYHYFRTPAELDRLRRVAAAARARDQIELDELFNDELLTRHGDADWVYPLGEIFVAALVNLHGKDAPGRVVSAFARPNAPEGLMGSELWQDAFQSCGFNLSDVVAGFFAALDSAVEEHEPFISSLTRLRGGVSIEGEQVVVRPEGGMGAGGRIVCRFRSRADTRADFMARVDAMGREGSNIQYQPWTDARSGIS